MLSTADRERGRRLRAVLEEADRELVDWIRFPATDPREDREEGCYLMLLYQMARKTWRDYANSQRRASRIPGAADTVLAAPPGRPGEPGARGPDRDRDLHER